LTRVAAGGITISDEKRAKVDTLLEELEVVGKTQTPRPLDNPLIWGNYEVSYVSSGAGQQSRGQPAGGRFQSSIGRAIFRTRGIFQSVLEPDIVTNKVEFALLGILRGAVGLRGRLEPEGSSGDTVKVFFEPPCINFGGLHLSFGPPSDVVLTTTYLDQRVRLGKGSRGSLFVFKRGGAADSAAMDQVGLEKSSWGAVAVTVALLAGLGAGCVGLWRTGAVLGRVAAGLVGVLLVAMSAVLIRGGIE